MARTPFWAQAICFATVVLLALKRSHSFITKSQKSPVWYVELGNFRNSRAPSFLTSRRAQHPRSRRGRFQTWLGASWSNGQAIQEYQDFLATGKTEMDLESDGASMIITDGMNPRLCLALLKLGKGDDVVLSPSDGAYPPLPPNLGGRTSYPIYVAVSPTTLASFLANMPQEYKDRYDDFVFFSGGPICGCIEPVLKEYGFCRDYNSQVLISGMTLPRDENDPRMPEDISIQTGLDSNGEEKWAGECAACGKWQGAFAERLERNNIRCRTGFYREWRRLMWERAAYDAVFNLVGAVREQPTTLADVSLYYQEEASDMLWQIATLLRGSLAVTMTYGFEDRMFDLAQHTGAETPCTLSGAMYPFTYEMFHSGPMIAEYLAFAVKDRGLLGDAQLPDRVLNGKMELNPIMRHGNLRADGVI